MGNSVLLTCHTVCTTLNYLIVFYILLLQVYKGLSAVTEVWIVLMVQMKLTVTIHVLKDSLCV